MPRVKRGTGRRDYRHKDPAPAKGFLSHQVEAEPLSPRSRRKGAAVRLCWTSSEKAQFPFLMDCAYQRRLPHVGNLVQQIRQRAQARRHHAKSQSAGRYCHQRCGRIPGSCWARQRSTRDARPITAIVFKVMEAAAQEQSIDSLAHLEERITRAVQAITTLRSENQQLQQRLKAALDELKSATGARDQGEARATAMQRERDELNLRVKTAFRRTGRSARRTQTGSHPH